MEPHNPFEIFSDRLSFRRVCVSTQVRVPQLLTYEGEAAGPGEIPPTVDPSMMVRRNEGDGIFISLPSRLR